MVNNNNNNNIRVIKRTRDDRSRKKGKRTHGTQTEQSDFACLYPPRETTIKKAPGLEGRRPTRKNVAPPSRSPYIIRLPFSPTLPPTYAIHTHTHIRRIYNNNIIIYCTVYGLAATGMVGSARGHVIVRSPAHLVHIHEAATTPTYIRAIYTACIQNACPIVRDSHTR